MTVHRSLDWTTAQTTGSAAEFHQRTPPGPFSPTLWRHDVTRPAVVLGSTQADDDIDQPALEAEGWEVCRRRSGGGLVVVIPGQSCWIDVFIGPDHPQWNDDISIAGLWIGDAWASALERLGRSTSPSPAPSISVHRGRLRSPADGRRYCFAGRGPGEVCVGSHKVVGLSQRRTRHGARFQCLALIHSPATSPELLGQLLSHCSPTVRQLIQATTDIGWPPGGQHPDLDALSATFFDVVRETGSTTSVTN